MTSLVVHFCSAPLVCFVDALDTRNIAKIIIAKHRKGVTGSVQLQFIDNLVRFESI